MTRENITGKTPSSDIIRIMAEGDSRAEEIINGILQDPFIGGPLTLLRLDDMNIRGKQITAGFDYCGSLPGFLACIATTDERMIFAINRAVPDETAVEAGASFERNKQAQAQAPYGSAKLPPPLAPAFKVAEPPAEAPAPRKRLPSEPDYYPDPNYEEDNSPASVRAKDGKAVKNRRDFKEFNF